MNLLIADQRTVIRRVVERLLRAQPDLVELDQVGTARDGVELLDRVRTELWDVVLLDISLPHWGGGRALERLKAAQPALPVIVHSDYTYPTAVQWCLDHGAVGFIATDALPLELVPCLRAALSGAPYVGIRLPS